MDATELKGIRLRFGLSQRQLAAAVGYSKKSGIINHMEKGRRRVTPYVALVVRAMADCPSREEALAKAAEMRIKGRS